MKSYIIALLLLFISVIFLVYIHEPNVKLYHITIIEEDEPFHPLLEKMSDFLHRQGNDINILTCDHLTSEIDRLYDFIYKPSLDQNDIVLFTTADNSVMIQSHKEIRKKYKLQQTPILFSGSANLENLENLEKDSFPNLESSMFIGRVWAIRSCFSGYEKNIETDPNQFWKSAQRRHPGLIKVDTQAQLFLYAEGTDKKDIHFDRCGGDIHYLKTDSYPYFLCAEDPEYLYTVVSRWKE